MQSDFVFTSESVTSGHPDKLCDRISDAIVGHYLRCDPCARVAAECAVSSGIVFLSVKFNTTASINVTETAREVIREVGYSDTDNGFNSDDCTVLTSLREVDSSRPSERQATGGQDIEAMVAEDQANLFGFACRQSAPLMPLPIVLAHKLARRLESARASRELEYLAPDGKVQVAVEFRAGAPYRIYGVTLLTSQHRAQDAPERHLHDELRERVLSPAFEDEAIRPDAHTRIAINPEGPLIPGGPMLHAGLTGRKSAIDTYGEFARHSGAALSGKDPGRIDRIGAYAARHAAKNVVAAGLAHECEVQLSYSIGIAEPVGLSVETFGTARIEEAKIAERLRRVFDFRPGAIQSQFELRALPGDGEDGFYRRLAAYGQVGRDDMALPWERTDRVDALTA